MTGAASRNLVAEEQRHPLISLALGDRGLKDLISLKRNLCKLPKTSENIYALFPGACANPFCFIFGLRPYSLAGEEQEGRKEGRHEWSRNEGKKS